MSEKSGNYSFSQIPTWIIFIASLLSALMLFLGGFRLGLKIALRLDGTGNTTQTENIESSESAENNPVPVKSKPLLTKTYGNVQIAAYVDDQVQQDAFIVVPVENGLPVADIGTYALSYAGNYYLMDNLFDVVGDKIYIVNQNRGFIDVYTLKYSENSADEPTAYQMKYADYIAGPKYDVGVPYSIICTGNTCDIKTAFHQEAGCEMKLDVATKQYTELNCSGMGGKITPQPVK